MIKVNQSFDSKESPAIKKNANCRICQCERYIKGYYLTAKQLHKTEHKH